MADAQVHSLAGFRQFFGLSRMTHSVLDVAHPVVGALLAAVVLGGPLPVRIILVGLFAAFAGYTAVFALNDLIDWKVDREKMDNYRVDHGCFDLDSLGQRHPIAQGSMSLAAGVAWVAFWGLISLAVAYWLRPACALFLLGAVALETLYCKLLRVTHWKGLISGLMVGVGGLAGVWAVTPGPKLSMVVVFFAWAFAWEVGGRNIPNDWSDIDEDRHLGIRTVPVRYGLKISARISFALVCATVVLSLLFPLVAAIPHPLFYLGGAVVVNLVFLLVPIRRWLSTPTSDSALQFFNMACFYPLAVLAVLLTAVIL